VPRRRATIRHRRAVDREASEEDTHMAVLVIGATGFIGPRLIRKLIARGESVVGMDLNPGAAAFGDVPIGAPIVRGDVTQFEDVMRTILDVKPERVINLAYGLGAGEGNPHQVMRLDILGMDNVFEACRLAGVGRVVYASSIAVSGQQSHFGDRLVTEDDPVHGTSQYAMHKIFNEFQARKYIKNYGMSIVGVRPANVTGPDKVRGSVDHVQIMTEAARGKPVHLPQKGLMRLLIHVEDIAEVFVRVLLADSPRHSLYNSGGIPASLGELADIVRGFLPDAQITFAQDGGREDSGNYLVDWSRLAKEFGIEYPGLHTRVLEVINDVRRHEGLLPVTAR
jgi:nucleoside-diphosphate-sugar epimerase